MDGCHVGRGEGQQMAVVCGFDAKPGGVLTVFLRHFTAKASEAKTIMHVYSSN